MVNMADLLKKAKRQLAARGKPDEAHPVSPEQEPLRPPTPKPGEGLGERKPFPAKKPLEFSETLRSRRGEGQPEDIASRTIRTPVPDEEETKKIYFESVESIKKIFNAYKENSLIDEKEITDTAAKIVDNVIAVPGGLLRLFYESDSPEFYTVYNAVDVSILSVEIGIAYNYNRDKLLDLAVVGLLHDIHLITSKDIIDMPKKLDKKELEELKKHPLMAASFVEPSFSFSKDIVNGILQHHERKAGEGYPSGLRDTEIQEIAEIIGIADTFESMTHSRPHKNKITPHQAIIEIIKSGKDLFSNRLIKALVSRISIYPIGSLVQLNTGEICKVLQINPNFPLRPVVSVLMDKDKKKFIETRTLDLQKTPSLYIKDFIEDDITQISEDEGG